MLYILASSYALLHIWDLRANGDLKLEEVLLFGTMWRFLWLANLFLLSRSDISCRKATDRCTRHFKCGLLLNQIFNTERCSRALGYDPKWNQINGPMQKTCPLTCAQAIKNLTSLPQGKAMESCACDSDSVCLTIKARMQRCVRSSEGNYTIMGCTEARKRCDKDRHNCFKTQQKFLKKCSALISGTNCTRECKDSQDELLNSELGKALNDCECDGWEEYICRGIRANYEKLCKATRSSRDPEVISTTGKQTVRGIGKNSSVKTQFELPVWILYVAIMAHVYVLYNR